MENYLVKKSDSASLINPSPNDLRREIDKINKILRTGKNAKPSA